MKCPTCNGDCIIPAEDVLDNILDLYIACGFCPPDPHLNKSAPLHETLDNNYGRCGKCGKRHLDFVIGNVLTILKENGLFPPDATLKEVGTPLISFGYQIPFPPRLGEKNLILVMDSITKELAGEIVATVPEIKGVIKRKGSQSQSIGILDTNSPPHTYELLSGCDMRCDIVSSSFGELCIYKSQSRIHIEFNNTKIRKIEELYFKGELNNACIVDAFCGPGTLGLLCVLGSARKVILNDAWLPAIKNAILNLKVNSNNLGLKILHETADYEKLIGDEPVLLAEAGGSVEIKVYHGDARKLDHVLKKADICLIDTFPGVSSDDFKSICMDIAKLTYVI